MSRVFDPKYKPRGCQRSQKSGQCLINQYTNFLWQRAVHQIIGNEKKKYIEKVIMSRVIDPKYKPRDCQRMGQKGGQCSINQSTNFSAKSCPPNYWQRENKMEWLEGQSLGPINKFMYALKNKKARCNGQRDDQWSINNSAYELE